MRWAAEDRVDPVARLLPRSRFFCLRGQGRATLLAYRSLAVSRGFKCSVGALERCCHRHMYLVYLYATINTTVD